MRRAGLLGRILAAVVGLFGRAPKRRTLEVALPDPVSGRGVRQRTQGQPWGHGIAARFVHRRKQRQRRKWARRVP